MAPRGPQLPLAAAPGAHGAPKCTVRTSLGACAGRGLRGVEGAGGAGEEAGPAGAPPPTGIRRGALVKEARGGGRGAHCSSSRRTAHVSPQSLALIPPPPSSFQPREAGRPLAPTLVSARLPPPPATPPAGGKLRTVTRARWANLTEQLCPGSGAGGVEE